MADRIDRATVRGIVAMVIGLFGYVVNDTFVKLLVQDMPLGQIIFIRGLFATAGVGLLVWMRGEWPGVGAFVSRPVMLRNGGELGGTVFYLTALKQMPLANATAILQAMPFVITAAAAILLGERVGWRRWTSILIGFMGVLLIVRPGAEGFNSYSVFAVIAVGFIALRDLATRYVAEAIPTLAVSLMANFVILPLAVVMGLFETWIVPDGQQMLHLGAAAFFLMIGYVFIILAMRGGEVSLIAPFRYTIILWALAIDLAVWGKVPAPLTLVGIVVIVASGLYMFFRERTVTGVAPGD